MARLKVLDTNAMIAVSQGKLAVEPADVRVVISVITRIELLAWPELSEAARKDVLRMVNAVETAQITPAIEKRVVELRTARTLKLPDAIVAGTALVLQAPLVSNDKLFGRVTGLVVEEF